MTGLDSPPCSHLSVSLLMRAPEVCLWVWRLCFLRRVFFAGFGGLSNVVLCDRVWGVLKGDLRRGVFRGGSEMCW